MSTIATSATKKQMSPLGQILKNNPGAIPVLKQDELIEAKFIGRTNKAAYFDLGRRGTGILYGLEIINAQDTLKELKEGGVVLVKVIEPENDDGYTELSLKETHKQKAWEVLKDLKDAGEVLKVKIKSANSGGLLTEIEGTQAFLPVSQLSSVHYPQVEEGDKAKILEELKKLVEAELEVKVIDVNPRTNKLIISEKAIASEDIKEKLDNYKVGDIIDGIITGVASFGAFMKFANDPSIEGLIHISELNHRLIENPKEVVKVDEVVKAKIVEIKDGRVSLSLKALQVNPWDAASGRYEVGQTVKGTITRFNPFGAFVSLDPDIQGLIHVSEFGGVEEMKKALQIGQAYDFTIELVKIQEKRIVLKLKR